MKFEKICTAVGISLRTGYNYCAKGMPRGPMDAVVQWIKTNKPHHVFPEGFEIAGADKPKEETVEQVGDPKPKTTKRKGLSGGPVDELAALEESYQACIANLKAEAAKDHPDFDLIIKGTQALARVGQEKRKEREAQERIESIRRQTDKAKEILVSAQARAKSMIQTMPRRISALLAHKDEAEIESILTADLDHFMRALQDGTLRA